MTLRDMIICREKETYQIGEEINEKIKYFLISGMEKGDLRKDLEIMPVIFNFWGTLSRIIQLVSEKCGGLQEEQKIDVDVVPGATSSSTVIKKAVENALRGEK